MGGVEVVLKFEFHRSPDILLDGLLAADRVMHPERVGGIDEVEQHLLVIAAQTNRPGVAAQADGFIDRARRILAAVDEVAEQYERVARGVVGQHFNE